MVEQYVAKCSISGETNLILKEEASDGIPESQTVTFQDFSVALNGTHVVTFSKPAVTIIHVSAGIGKFKTSATLSCDVGQVSSQTTYQPTPPIQFEINFKNSASGIVEIWKTESFHLVCGADESKFFKFDFKEDVYSIIDLHQPEMLAFEAFSCRPC